MTSLVHKNLHILWDYMHLNTKEPLHPADCIIGFGCINDDIALRCVQLYQDGFAPRILFTGGLGRNTLGRWTQSEAEHFAAIAMQNGVPEDAILLETKSTNSAENILFSRTILEHVGLSKKQLICVHKPYMERRLYAAMKVYWDTASAQFTSPLLSMDTYILNTMKQGLDEHSIIDIIVGDVQRMDIYAKLGYQIPQEIPDTVQHAFQTLVNLGYTNELVETTI